MSGAFALRRAGDVDQQFLLRLFASTRATELAYLPATLHVTFIGSQHSAQQAQYASAFPQADHCIVIVDDSSVGRLVVDRSQAIWHLVDISLLPQHCGQGLGTGLLLALIAEARAAGSSLSLFVRQDNPARRLYERLGFVEQGGDDWHRRMVLLRPGTA